ncbi:cysteine desulfurase family protein [Ammoniphilus sp. CFH 90114]|uniref:cysteine desulfurase family protein n=1 Tax=Ammoniphilus sp. CFH 90114 TaxID=2493665 RepID=UPI00100FFA14|nr:cysteine desulfurase family protein [Ammoniphilus sp. CFH 90114]RXT13536.1 cysteine desulfurase [Ammoniphilus sp. CFH 90114]
MIYFDNGATTAPHPEVVETMRSVLQNYYGNPSSLHHLGVESEKILNQSRQLAAKFLGVQPGEVVFTSGATESNNMAIKGIAFRYQNRGKHIVTTAIEHPAVYDVCKQLEEFGFELTVLPVNQEGVVNLEDLESAIRSDTVLVSVMHVNNEVGSVQPLAEIGRILKKYPKLFFHVDAVQGFGKLPVDPRGWGADLVSLSAHKFHGPKGTGLLYVRKGVDLYPLMVGGGQEGGLRSGTENLAGIVGMVKAMRLAKESMESNSQALLAMRDRLWESLNEWEGCFMNTPRIGAPHIVNISLPGLKSEVILHALEDQFVYVSTKSACSSKIDRPSRVLMAMNLGEARASSSLRLSLSYMNTMSEVEKFLMIFHDVVPRLKKMLKVT